jgi:hypothetical protein
MNLSLNYQICSLKFEQSAHSNYVSLQTDSPLVLDPMSTPPTYVVNERVLCYHGPLVYEAKVSSRYPFVRTY